MRGDWNQKWRGPLRRALDSLRDVTRPLYKREASLLLKDALRSLDDYRAGTRWPLRLIANLG